MSPEPGTLDVPQALRPASHAAQMPPFPAGLSSLPPADNTSFINKPIQYGSGQFCGRTIRIELHEEQKANLGRKYAQVDRRPLDPPPVVQMRIYEVLNMGSEGETECEIPDYDSIEVLGFVCTVDLFPISRLTKERRKINQPYHSPAARLVQPSTHPAGAIPPPQYISSAAARAESDTLSSSHESPHDPHLREQSCDTDPPDVIYHVDGYPLSERSKTTSTLVGATFVQPVALDYRGRRCLMFVFADLAVKTEGYFILRYRVFDIFAKPVDHTERVIQAECYGGIFRVYSTKEFPGLPASTDLTKQLARWGVKLNIREAERKRRRKGDSRSQSPIPSRSAMIFPTAIDEKACNSTPSPASRKTDDTTDDDTKGNPTSPIAVPSRKRLK